MARRPAQPKRCALRLPIRIKITIKIKSRTSGPSHKRHIREPPLRRCGWGKTNRYFMPESPDSTDSTPLKELAADKTGALDPQDTVETAGDCMREHDTAQWPVAEGRKLVGMIDEKNPNPDWEMGGHGHDPKCWRVGEIMHREFVFCYEDQDCGSARQLMEERGLDYLPVVDREMRIVGIFSREEIAAGEKDEG